MSSCKEPWHLWHCVHRRENFSSRACSWQISFWYSSDSRGPQCQHTASPVVNTPGSRFNTPGSRFDTPGSRFDTPGGRFNTPGIRFNTPGVRFNTPGSRFNTPGSWFNTPGSRFNTQVTDKFHKEYPKLNQLVIHTAWVVKLQKQCEQMNTRNEQMTEHSLYPTILSDW